MERLDIELNVQMRNMFTQLVRDELEREAVLRTMETPEKIKEQTQNAITLQSIPTPTKKEDSTEIGAAAFVATVTFLLALFNAYRFAMLFYKSRNTEKLVATDMTFASAE